MTSFDLVGTVATFSGCTFSSWAIIEVTSSSTEPVQRITDKAVKQYEVTLRRSAFDGKVFIIAKNTTRHFTIYNCKMKKIELKLGQFASATYILVKVINSVFTEYFDLISAFRNTYVTSNFLGCTIERELSLNGQATRDPDEHPADVAVILKDTAIIMENVKINEITSVDVIDCDISGKIINITGRDVEETKCCSSVTFKNSRFTDIQISCKKASLSKLLLLTQPFTLVNTTFSASTSDGPHTLLSISRKNAVLENVQVLCPLKVTADLTDDKQFKLMCSVQ